MNEALKRPYEISVWQDALMTAEVPGEVEGTTKEINYYKEQKVMIIGSDKMTSPNKVFNPILTENINGEKTLSFSLRYRYYDPGLEQEVTNPFAPYLINERKIKLYYDDKWYDFVIKECNESSDEYIFDYTARDQFALELGKVGYNITLSTELNNNQGTITELAEKVLESTDWTVDKENSDLLTQTVKEPIYEAHITGPITVLNVNTNEEVELQNDEDEENIAIYIFYSYIANNQTEHVQFILKRDRPDYIFDDNNVVTSTNYRFLDEVEFVFPEEETEEEIEEGGDADDVGDEPADSAEDETDPRAENVQQINIIEIFNEFQAYRLVYDKLVVYDPIMQRTVTIYEAQLKNKTQQIYHYNDYEYTTSEILTNFVTNGSDFNTLKDGSLQGWSNAVPTSGKQEGSPYELQPITLVTDPDISSANVLSKLSNFAKVRGFLELKFKGTADLDKGTNMYFNSGIEDNASIIDHIAAGEEYAFRIRFGWCNQDLQLKDVGINSEYFNRYAGGSEHSIKAIITKYELIKEEFNDGKTTKVLYGYKPLPGGTLFKFEGPFKKVNNVIDNGIFSEDKKSYLVDDVVQTPSSNYIYIEETDTERIPWVWDANLEEFVLRSTVENWLDYYMTTAKARYSVSNSLLSDPTTKIGLFLYTESPTFGDNHHYLYIEDIQITKYREDAEGKPVTIGNVPTARSIEQDYYYLKPTAKMTKDKINVYGSLEYLAMETGITIDTVTPIYNEKCEKILTIEEAQSNCFNIIQSLCETFECWMKMEVRHNSDGTLWLDKNYNPSKKIVFKKYVGKENFSGFKYGINLNSISRSIDSNEFVTKLIVDTASSDYTDSGTLSIQNASTNPSNESYILNFSYYLNKGLIPNVEECNADVNKFYEDLKEINTEIFNLERQRIDLEKSILNLTSKKTVYDSLISEAKKEYDKSLEKFEKTTGIDYFEYVERQETLTPDEEIVKLQENENVIKIIAEIYSYASTIDINGGLLSNLNKEYDELKLELEGAQEYAVNITTNKIEDGNTIRFETQVTIDEYLEGFKFLLINDYDKLEYETTLNDRIFNVVNPTALTNFMINKVPKNYLVEFYSNNKAYRWLDDIKNLNIEIYNPLETSSLTRRITLVPNDEYKEQYTGINQLLDEARAVKEKIEKEFYKKYSRFIQEGTWNSSDYIDDELYYYDALQVSRVSAQPKVSYSISVSEVSEIEGLENYHFNVGDKTFVEDPDFFGYLHTAYEGRVFKTPIKEEVIVSEVTWNLDAPEENTITVQNYKTQFEDLFQRISATVQTLQYNEATYPKISSVVGANGLIDTELLLQSWNEGGAAGYNLTTTGAIRTVDDGIIVQDLQNGGNYVKIESRGIKTSTDGGQTWLNVIDGYGINADAINAGIINTQQIWLMDGDNPSFRWDKSGISAYGFGEQADGPYDLKTYVRFDKYGLYGIQNGENWVASELDDIKDTAQFGLTWDGFFIKNSYQEGYVSISSDDDFQIVSTNINRTIEVPPYEEIIITLSTNSNTLVLPIDDGEVTKITTSPKNGAIVDVTELNTYESSLPDLSEEITEYTVANGIITLTNWEPALDSWFDVTYTRAKNKLDLGGDGILELKSVYVNGNAINYESFDKRTGVITFPMELTPGDAVTINYVLERIKIGAFDFINGAPTKYGIKVKNNSGETVFETNDEGNLSVTGTIYANDGVFRGTVYATDGEFAGHIKAYSGEFPGSITVGKGNENYILIDGSADQPYIASSDYLRDSQSGWIINGEGDAIFNNVSVRGAIKTSVFEYSEIQAVGGAFLFRPSVVVKSGVIRGEDLVLTLEQGNFFKIGDWCKVGNFAAPESKTGLQNAGLAAVYKVINVSPDGKTVILEGAAELFL